MFVKETHVGVIVSIVVAIAVVGTDIQKAGFLSKFTYSMYNFSKRKLVFTIEKCAELSAATYT